mmetsp:Transcript_14951/g.25551  ORF Transcript_14951/g.25551 Transcript_14951/m.25551 type:complete len:175 (-) Transcript_14951:427-951(-)
MIYYLMFNLNCYLAFNTAPYNSRKERKSFLWPVGAKTISTEVLSSPSFLSASISCGDERCTHSASNKFLIKIFPYHEITISNHCVGDKPRCCHLQQMHNAIAFFRTRCLKEVVFSEAGLYYKEAIQLRHWRRGGIFHFFAAHFHCRPFLSGRNLTNPPDRKQTHSKRTNGGPFQ